LPRLRILDITSDRLDLVKTSAMGNRRQRLGRAETPRRGPEQDESDVHALSVRRRAYVRPIPCIKPVAFAEAGPAATGSTESLTRSKLPIHRVESNTGHSKIKTPGDRRSPGVQCVFCRLEPDNKIRIRAAGAAASTAGIAPYGRCSQQLTLTDTIGHRPPPFLVRSASQRTPIAATPSRRGTAAGLSLPETPFRERTESRHRSTRSEHHTNHQIWGSTEFR
jgi:hypothetical protein